MIDIGMYVALGFLLASLLALMVAPAFWKRAVRLTRRRVEMTMPMSAADIQADKDQLRAEFAIELRRVEVALEKAKDKAARELVEANKRRVEISEINTELESIKGRLNEKHNANRVLEQTIRRRLPELEGRLKAAKEAMAELEAANAELRNTAGAQAEALKLARSTLSSQRGDIDQLRGALEGEASSSRRSAKSDATLAKENRRLSAELSKLKQVLAEGRIGGNENGLLRDELGKLASQVLAVAKAQGTRLPDFAPLAPPPALEHGGREPHFGPEPAFVSRNGGDAREEPSAPEPLAAGRPHEPLVALSVEDAGHEEAEAEPEATGSLAKLLSARKARRRGAKGRRTGSLSERLKNLSAESPDS
jgi:predicted  nucleic acid-binding Zn-ribbon protein